MINSVTIGQFYTAEVVTVSLLLTYIMIKAEQDVSNVDNEPWLRMVRCGAFTIASILVSATVIFGKNWPAEAFILGSILLSLALPILMVDAFKLYRRGATPPTIRTARIQAHTRRRAF
jgi:hypothetical protein